MQLPEPRILGLKKQAVYGTTILQKLKVGGILDQLSNEAAKHRLPIRPGFMKVGRIMRRECGILLKGDLHVCGKVGRGEDEILNSVGESVWKVQAQGLILKPVLVETLKVPGDHRPWA
jgi:hypothetical protein